MSGQFEVAGEETLDKLLWDGAELLGSTELVNCNIVGGRRRGSHNYESARDAALAKAIAEAATINSVIEEAARNRSEEEHKAAKVAEVDEETARFQWRDYVRARR